ncbi:hypothetical protein AEAC466_18200 [Asticcacaulis sp. AC466]|uniref:hypothetical protein n=1 Tax=Asticcacaulis sp. AC466 TaxID=1282362 RepID=UPI0003C3BE4E|nr:hypothetical protein [Asticcacaulis sp. AC466]ESQ82279.1 hypothetical protein AEAC466_18200 [Asticcacaulis sp. AC466]
MAKNHVWILIGSGTLIGSGLLSGCAAGLQTPPNLAGIQDMSVREQVESDCRLEARWPTYQSAAYRGGAGRVREQLTNFPSGNEAATIALCARLERATQANASSLADDCKLLMEQRRLRYGDAALSNITRFQDVCRQLTGR